MDFQNDRMSLRVAVSCLSRTPSGLAMKSVVEQATEFKRSAPPDIQIPLKIDGITSGGGGQSQNKSSSRD
jgi:hypothetical protein